jgi:hypothetical protein
VAVEESMQPGVSVFHVRHGRNVVFQLAEVAVPRSLFAEILRRIRPAARIATVDPWDRPIWRIPGS